jgi:monovalent cation:H+ antiporter-2, CPA2 family
VRAGGSPDATSRCEDFGVPFDLAQLIPNVELTEELRFILDVGTALGAALIAGAIAVRFGQPAIIGYIAAGVVVGPFTPGFVGDVERISTLAELGVVLLLFALGVEFSLRELGRVRRVVIPGALLQIVIITVVGAIGVMPLGLDLRAAVVIGAALAISSTLVTIKVLTERGELDSLHARTAVGWMIIQDLATIVFMAALPPLAGGDPVAPIVLALIRAAAFLAVAFLVGARVLPWLFRVVARLGSRELFLLAVFATALLTAFISSALFGLSLALGAFVGGLLVSESDLSHQAAAEILPFRDLFAVLFFVSVGMLLDPAALVTELPAVALLVLIAVAGKALVTALLGRSLGMPMRSAILLGVVIAQVGEFSFLLAENALDLRIIDADAYNLILGAAVLSIVLGPVVVPIGERIAVWWELRSDRPEAAVAGDAAIAPVAGATRGERELAPGDAASRRRIVVLGAGRVGRIVVRAVRMRGFACLVVDRDQRALDEVARLGAETLFGDAANPEILHRCDLDRAPVLCVAIGDHLTARLAVERARRISPRLTIAARARGRREISGLLELGVRRVADPEAEAAFELGRTALQRMGVSSAELNAIVVGLRRDAYGPTSTLAPSLGDTDSG